MTDPPLQWLNIGALPRVTEFPYRVSTVGWLHRGNAHYCGSHEGGFEFCLRLRSDAEEAVDRFGGKLWRTRYPHLVIQHPGVPHEYDEPASRESFFFIYQPSMAPLLELAGVDFGAPVLPVSVPERMRKVIDFARDDLFPRVTERGVADELDALCWFVLTNMLAQCPADKRRGSSAGRARAGVNAGDAVAQRLRAAEERMRLGFSEDIDFGDLAREAGMSRRTFFRRWADVFRNTPQAHLREIRLLNAARGLVLDLRSVSEVASSCGFPNPSYFAALFRRRFGVSPQRYRSRELKTLGWRDNHDPIT